MSIFFSMLGHASVLGLITLVVACCAQRVLDGRVPAKWRVWLWRVALLQTALALVPFAPLRLSVLPPRPVPVTASTLRSVTPRFQPSFPERASGQAAVDSTPKRIAPVGNATPSANEDANGTGLPPLPFAAWVFVLGCYALGLIVQGVMLARAFWRVRRVLRTCATLESPLVDNQLCAIARRMRVTALPRLLVLDGGAPFLAGVFRPAIVVPSALLQNQNQSLELEAILCHELAHLKRCDLAWNALLWPVQAVLWFHPLTWVARHFLRLETESACDEMVLSSTRIAPTTYGALLLNTLSQETSPLTAGVNDGFSAFKTRLSRLNQQPKRPKTMVKFAFVGALVLALAAALPLRFVARAQNTAAPGEPTIPTKPQLLPGQKPGPDPKQVLIAEAGLVTGRVLTPTQQPVPNARISWISYVTNSSFSAGGTVLRSVQSDAQGRFRFDDAKVLLSRSLKFAGSRRESALPQLLIETRNWGFTVAPILYRRPKSAPLEVRLAPATALQTVFHDDNGQPVPNLKVRLSALNFTAPSQPIRSSTFFSVPRELKRFSFLTDINGVCRIADLPQGTTARLAIDDERFAQLSYQDGNVNLERAAQTLARPIRLTAGATVRGRVTYGPSGEPVAGVGVGAQSLGESAWGDAITDREGYYQIAMLRPGSYNIALALEANLNTQWTARAHEAVAVAPGDRVPAIDFTLEHGALITGHVLAQGSREPIEGLPIGIYGPAHPLTSAWVQAVSTDHNGAYQLRVPGGQQSIYIQSNPPAGFAEPTGPPTASVTLSHSSQYNKNYEFTIDDGQTATITWQLPKIKPAPTVKVQVLNSKRQPVERAQIEFGTPVETGVGMAVPSVQTDSEGRVNFKDIRSATQLRARWGWGPNAEATLRPTLAKPGQSVTLVLQPKVLGTLKGRVIDASGKPLPRAQVDLIRWFGAGQDESGYNGGAVNVDDQGRFNFSQLWPDGTYSLQVNADGYGQAQTETMQLKPGETRELKSFVLAKADTFIEGKVVDENNQPVAGAYLSIHGVKTAQQQTTTDRLGHFRLDSVVSNDTMQIRAQTRSRNDARYGQGSAPSGTSDVVVVLKSR